VCRVYGHDSEGGERAGEDDEARVAHGHDGGDDERLVADLRYLCGAQVWGSGSRV